MFSLLLKDLISDFIFAEIFCFAFLPPAISVDGVMQDAYVTASLRRLYYGTSSSFYDVTSTINWRFINIKDIKIWGKKTLMSIVKLG